jgi:hypothetical protein
MAEWVVVDLDSTLADTRHRHHLIETSDPDWDTYSLACADDVPVLGVVQVVRMLSRSYPIAIISGRSRAAYGPTVEWLKRHRVPWSDLVLKDVGDRSLPVPWKVNAVKSWLSRHPQDRVALIIEDWAPMRPVFEGMGMPVLLVQPGYGVLG